MPPWHGTRPLKRWRYVAVFTEELAACAALVRIGPARQSFWALHLRGGTVGERDDEAPVARGIGASDIGVRGELRERTRLWPRRGEVVLDAGRPASASTAAVPGRLHVRDRGVTLELALDEQPGIEALCPHGRARVWTRKQAGVRAHGTLALDGAPPKSVEGLAVIDDTAGHHARHTEWWWSAGVGTSTDGAAVAWNLVSGVNDPPHGSERAVWVGGAPRETEPVSFATDLSSIVCTDGSRLEFHAEAERSRHDDLLIVSSEYRAPFGTFSGTLPGGVALAHGHGVVEHHRARW